ncbi:MAG: shikimate kinase [Lentimicrobium sp.]|jgi:shikimate kinase|nr:shikimate kinase [Lentimicrobium sp.]
MAKPVFIVGYMGSGKSTVGKKVAGKLGYKFVDMDVLIVDLVGESIPEIFSSKGEDAFRQLERSVLQSLCSRSNTVVSTGGGAPCFFDNMKLMNNSGITVYLNMQVRSLSDRLQKSKLERPLLPAMPADDLEQYISRHLTERIPYYNEARLVVKGENADIDHLVKSIRDIYAIF